FNRQTVNGCDSIVTLHLTVKPAALDMDDLTDYIRCNGGTFSVTPTGNIPEGTQYVWTVEDNANVTGQSAQTTPVDAPISQTLVNNSSVAQTVIYHVTPMTNDCTGDEFTITVEVEPTPELTLNCPDEVTLTLEFGSCALLIAPADLGTPTWAHSLGWSLINISNNLQEGELYPEGDHIITWTMSDECGNMTTCDQHVHVIFPQCPDAVDYEGNVYHGVRIDCDCWTQRNLESHKYSDGTDIPGIYSYISDMYPDSAINAGTFGLLYDWESAIRDGQDNGHDHVQGICPEGWYLPTAEKYDALNAHGAAALKSPDYWIDGGGNNSTGFTSLPGGYYDGSIERYINLMGEAYYWSTTKVNGQWSSSAYTIQHACDSVNGTSTRNGLGYSVRCILEKN
ncbi:MAG: fibrobacter succinogenes major paralogous domain-containing protein, partial [Bacteroidales bacterium]|nr:fibrobacter succinogenes major paralogous domain-containing protein [Bacteroidales bacterium]